MHSSPIDQFLVAAQRWIPTRLIGRLMYYLSRSKMHWLKNALINSFSWLYNVDTSEAEHPVPEGYESFNQFFTRNLRDGARIIELGPENFVSPADGTIAQTGKAVDDQLIQAKGMQFSMTDLLADERAAKTLVDCHFATIYLAPYNYHRLHMPFDGTLRKTLFIPGLLYSVNARTTANVPNLYAVNERLVCLFDSLCGPFAMVLVGAMNVASISTAWDGEIPPPHDYRIRKKIYTRDEGPHLMQGEYMGHFNMGSTVVLLGPPCLSNWLPELHSGSTVRMGQRLGAIAAAQ
jgi:phosphatidylserine decarboxylase